MECPGCGKKIEGADVVCPSCGRTAAGEPDDATVVLKAEDLTVRQTQPSEATQVFGSPQLTAEESERRWPEGPTVASSAKTFFTNPWVVVAIGFLVILAVVGGFGIAQYLNSEVNKAKTATPATNGGTPSDKNTVAPQVKDTPSTTVESPTDVVIRYYQAVVAENYGEAKDLMTASTAGSYDPLVLFKGAKLTGYNVEPIAVDPDKATVRGIESLTAENGTALVYTAEFSLVKVDGRWLIENIGYTDTGEEDVSSETDRKTPEETAAGVMTVFLTKLKEKRFDEAKQFATDAFISKNAGYFKAGAIPELTTFEIVETKVDLEMAEVTVKETRGGDVGERRYKLLFDPESAMIDEVFVVD
ncbi:MAG: zinc ribbon domain-containing protein [Candidatus Aquicultorales bacterium]